MIFTELEYSQQRESALRDTNENLEREAEELERRVRWLESVLIEAESYAWASELQDCANTVLGVVLVYPNETGGEKRVKPTPEDFK